MAFGCPPKHVDWFSIPDGEGDLRAIVRDSLNAFAWWVIQDHGQSIRATVDPGLFSPGQRVQIAFESEHVIRISSESAFALPCYDWGKNKRNVERLLSALRRRSLATRD
ncbi:hypothetical protein F2Q65_12300 [Thiohalocapsa marina]|uniref:DUF1499 domain-containing protein n=1 Tax=Thiohalocapsa marina TaxID=424902 RepID=A0A5M8FIH7_9GAMM|nr:hypothetical protein [Thiohalocapsa marina]KAA6184487.1 hypothetical protein F2Q65_12300 [Thiohalocapsa marina]